jgi:hypothetical protein
MAAFVPESDYTGASRDEWLAAPAAPAAMEGVIKLRGLPFTATKQVRSTGEEKPFKLRVACTVAQGSHRRPLS